MSWALRLAAAVRNVHASQSRVSTDLVDVTVSGERLEVLFTRPPASFIFGVRLVESDFRHEASARLRSATAEELAFDIVYVAMSEPLALCEYTSAGVDGVRWLPLAAWDDS